MQVIFFCSVLSFIACFFYLILTSWYPLAFLHKSVIISMTLISISIDSTFSITPGHDSLNYDLLPLFSVINAYCAAAAWSGWSLWTLKHKTKSN